MASWISHCTCKENHFHFYQILLKVIQAADGVSASTDSAFFESSISPDQLAELEEQLEDDGPGIITPPLTSFSAGSNSKECGMEIRCPRFSLKRVVLNPKLEDERRGTIFLAPTRRIHNPFSTGSKLWEFVFPIRPRTSSGMLKTDENVRKVPKTKSLVNTNCICSNSVLRDLNTAKGNMLLDVLTLIVNVFAFHVPFNGYPTIPTIMNPRCRGSISSITNLKKSQNEKICRSNTHMLQGIGKQYTFEDLIAKIGLFGRTKDVDSIRFYFMLAPRSKRREMCDVFCKERRYPSFIIQTIVEMIKDSCRKIYKSKYKISKVWLGRKSQKREVFRLFPVKHEDSVSGFDTIVVVIKDSIQNKNLSSLWGFDLILVSENVCNSEAYRILQLEVQNPTEAIVWRVIKKDLSDLLNNHSNITMVNISNVRCQGFGTSDFRVRNTPTLVIYCHVKGVIPFGEQMFPKQVSEFEVDVREGTCCLAVQGLRMSENISADDCVKFGTLGGFVDLQNPPRRAFLTCAHVVLPKNTLQNQLAEEYVRRREIIRVFDKEKNEIGKITKAVFYHGQSREVSVDAALIEITDRHPSDGFFSDVFLENQLSGAGFSEEQVPHFSNGQIEQMSTFNFRKQVIKVGASSGLTLGSLRIGRSCARIMDDCDVNIEGSFNIRLFGQLEVLPRIDPTQPSDSRQAFVSDGDSGALVFAIHNENPIVLKCIGMVVATTSYGSCLMTPIDKVLDALGLPYNCLSKFSIPRSNQESESGDLRDVLTSITQQLTVMTSSMATKTDVESLKKDLEKFNDRLTIAESIVREARGSDTTEVNSSGDDEL